MSKVPYTKTALLYADQLQQLKNRGLLITNEPKALHLLEVISYYRLSGYVINPKHKVQSKFKALLAKYPNIDTWAMGFPDNWRTETFWQ